MNNHLLPDLEDVLMYQLHRCGRLLRFYLQKFLDDAPATPEQFFLLYQLYLRDGQTQRELADRVLNDHPNITRLIDKLEEKGMVRRNTSEKSRRAFSVVLTEEGRRLFDSVIPVIERERERLLRGISDKEQDTVMKVLKKLERNIAG